MDNRKQGLLRGGDHDFVAFVGLAGRTHQDIFSL